MLRARTNALSGSRGQFDHGTRNFLVICPKTGGTLANWCHRKIPGGQRPGGQQRSWVVDIGAGKASDSGAPHGDTPDRSTQRDDESGFSYVEVLVAIVIVGVSVIATLVGLRTTVISGRVGTERSQLLLWTQEAAEALHRDPYVPCNATQPIDTYQATVDLVALPTD